MKNVELLGMYTEGSKEKADLYEQCNVGSLTSLVHNLSKSEMRELREYLIDRTENWHFFSSSTFGKSTSPAIKTGFAGAGFGALTFGIPFALPFYVVGIGASLTIEQIAYQRETLTRARELLQILDEHYPSIAASMSVPPAPQGFMRFFQKKAPPQPVEEIELMPIESKKSPQS